ncbi:MAG: hypothetical protein V4696_01575 [Pseudomonadota bacterium]
MSNPVGRPRGNPYTTKSGCISIRVDPTLAALIKGAAEENSRSVSAEVEGRLAASFGVDPQERLAKMAATEHFLVARLREVRAAKEAQKLALTDQRLLILDLEARQRRAATKNENEGLIARYEKAATA